MSEVFEAFVQAMADMPVYNGYFVNFKLNCFHQIADGGELFGFESIPFEHEQGKQIVKEMVKFAETVCETFK